MRRRVYHWKRIIFLCLLLLVIIALACFLHGPVNSPAKAAKPIGYWDAAYERLREIGRTIQSIF